MFKLHRCKLIYVKCVLAPALGIGNFKCGNKNRPTMNSISAKILCKILL